MKSRFPEFKISKLIFFLISFAIVFGAYISLTSNVDAGYCTTSPAPYCIAGQGCTECRPGTGIENNGCEVGVSVCCEGNGVFDDSYNNDGCHCEVYDCGGGGGESCSCTPSCKVPTQAGFTFTTPADGTTLNLGSVINWKGLSGSEWGLDQTPSACSNDECAMTSYSGNGYYKLFRVHYNADRTSVLVNVTDMCTESLNAGEASYIPGTSLPKCTIKKYNPILMGLRVEFVIKAYNSLGDVCQPAEARRHFLFPTSENPACIGVSATSSQTTTHTRPYDGGFTTVLDRNSKLSLTAYGKDDYAYGDPRIGLCYSVAGQSAAFYQKGPLAWQCSPLQTTRTYTTPSGADYSLQQRINSYLDYMNGYAGKTTRLDQVKSLLSSTNLTLSQIIEQKGLVVTTNVFDNKPLPDGRPSPNFCSSNTGYNNGNGVYFEYYPEPFKQTTCVADRCTLLFHNRPPEITYMYPSNPLNTFLIGSSANEFPTYECQDNNPYTSQLYVRDPDGAYDIDNLEYNVAQTWAATPTQTWPNVWPLRALFSRYGENDFGNVGTVFSLRDADFNDENYCYARSGETFSRVLKQASHYNCYKMPDGHNWRVATALPGVVYFSDGPYKVYYLSADIIAYSRGRVSKMKGSSNWQNASFVAYSTAGTNVRSNFVIEIAPDSGKSWEGDYVGVWQVQDRIGLNGLSKGVDSLPSMNRDILGGETVLHPNGKGYHTLGKMKVDLTGPTYTKKLTYFNTAGTNLMMEWALSDTRTHVRSAKGHLQFTPTNSSALQNYVQDKTAILAGDSMIRTNYYPYANRDYMSSYSLWNRSITYASDTEKVSPSTETRIENIDISKINIPGTYLFSLDGSDVACNRVSTSASKVVQDIPAVCGETCSSLNATKNNFTCLTSTICSSSSTTKCWVNPSCPNESSCDCPPDEPPVCRGFCEEEGEYNETGSLWCKRTTESESEICPPEEQDEGCLIWVNPDCSTSENCICDINCRDLCETNELGSISQNGELSCRTTELSPMGRLCPNGQTECNMWLSSDTSCNEFDCNCEESEIFCGNTCSQEDAENNRIEGNLICENRDWDMIVCPNEDPFCFVRWCPVDNPDCDCSEVPDVEIVKKKNWMLTAGGLVYSEGGMKVTYPTFPETQTNLSSDLPGKFANYAINLIGFSTEWYGTNEPSVEVPTLLHKDTSGIFVSGNTSDKGPYSDNNRMNLHTEINTQVSAIPSYDNFATDYKLIEKKCTTDPTCRPDVDKFTFTPLTTLCGVNPSIPSEMAKLCVIKIEDYQSAVVGPGLSSDYICNMKAVILIDSSLQIDIPIVTDSTKKNGCIFVVKNDVTISGLGNKLSDANIMKYDHIESYIASAGKIVMQHELPPDDQPNLENVFDGLYIKGSLITTGQIVFEREIENDQYPAFLLEYDPRYLKIYREIFKNSSNSVIRELGGR